MKLANRIEHFRSILITSDMRLVDIVYEQDSMGVADKIRCEFEHIPTRRICIALVAVSPLLNAYADDIIFKARAVALSQINSAMQSEAPHE